ncbi:type II toxin-antitoxin system ParD family antitoxin [Nitrosomonas sp. wSCUT-2]
MFEERETKLEALCHALIEGEQSGASDYSLQGIFDELEDGDQLGSFNLHLIDKNL